MISAALLLAPGMVCPQQPEPRAPADESETLSAPALVRAGGAPIDVEVGHAAPLMHDWDGDGTADLLVGQFGGGSLRVYTNAAETGTPELRPHTWGKSGRAKLKVPSG